MKLLFIGDPHLKVNKLETCKKFLEWIEVVVQQEQPDVVVNLGDTFDTHAVIRSEILCTFIEHVRGLLHRRRIRYVYLLGNHDMYKPDNSKYHVMLPFKNLMPDFNVIDKPTHMFDNMTFVPYVHDFKKFPTDLRPITVAHQTFVGADYGYYRPDVGVDADALATEIIISGHVHKRQSFGKVVYPGTPFAQGLDDINQSKGVMIFDTQTYEYSFIDSPFPKWRGVKYSLEDIHMNKIHDDLLKTLNSTDNWIVELRGPKAEIMAYMDSDKWKDIQKLSSIRMRPDYTDKIKVSRKKVAGNSVSDIFCDYIDNVYDGSLDKKVLKSTALDVLNSDV